MDREPRAPRLHAPRARLPRLRRRGRAGARRSPRRVERGLALKKTGQRGDDARRRPRDPPDQRPRRRLLPRADAARAARRSSTRSSGRARPRSRPCAGRPGFDFPERAVDCELVALSEPGRLRDRARPDRLRPRASTSPSPSTTSTSSRSTSSARTRSTRGCADGGTYLCGPLARFALSADRLSPLAREAAREAGLEPPCRDPFRSIVVRSVELVYACDEALRLIDGVRGARRAGRRGRAARRRRLRRTRGAARPPLPPLRARRRRARSSTRRSSRRRRRTSWRSRTTCASVVEPLRRRSPTTSCARLRADDPQLRPVHLVRDALPRPRGRARVSDGRDRRRQRVPRRRRRRARGRRARPRASRPSVDVLECEQEPTRLLDAWEGADAGARRRRGLVGRGARDGAPLRRERRARCPRRVFRASTHAFGVGEAVELARALGPAAATRRSSTASRARRSARATSSRPAVAAAVEPLAAELREEAGCTSAR